MKQFSYPPTSILSLAWRDGTSPAQHLCKYPNAQYLNIQWRDVQSEDGLFMVTFMSNFVTSQSHVACNCIASKRPHSYPKSNEFFSKVVSVSFYQHQSVLDDSRSWSVDHHILLNFENRIWKCFWMTVLMQTSGGRKPENSPHSKPSLGHLVGELLLLFCKRPLSPRIYFTEFMTRGGRVRYLGSIGSGVAS